VQRYLNASSHCSPPVPIQQTVKCDACGADAIVLATEGVLFSHPGKPASRIVLQIKCPKCGAREQPASSARN
jgi:ribosomal protein S27E